MVRHHLTLVPLRVRFALVRYTKTRLPLAHFTPADLIHLREPFDSEAYVFELKMDGFRALAHVTGDGARLVSRPW